LVIVRESDAICLILMRMDPVRTLLLPAAAVVGRIASHRWPQNAQPFYPTVALLGRVRLKDFR
jgi:hypothetical protein